MFGFSSNRASKICDLRNTQDEEVSSSFKKNRNEVETTIHEVKCKSPQGGCIGEECEDECTSSFFVSDLQVSAKDVGSCEGGETSFGSYPKEVYKLDL